MITHVARLADVAASLARETREYAYAKSRSATGPPGAPNGWGVWGAIWRLSPMSRLRSRAKARDYEYAK